MHVEARHEFSAPCAEVYAMTIDPDFLATAARDLGSTDTSANVETTAEGAVTRVSVVLPTPAPIATFAGPTVTVGQQITWSSAEPDGSRTAEVIIKLAGLPVSVTATAHLHPTPNGTAIDYDGDLGVAVPLLGPALEKQAAPFVRETLDAQQRSGIEWLAQH